jgi:hypothetical protein
VTNIGAMICLRLSNRQPLRHWISAMELTHPPKDGVRRKKELTVA